MTITTTIGFDPPPITDHFPTEPNARKSIRLVFLFFLKKPKHLDFFQNRIIMDDGLPI